MYLQRTFQTTVEFEIIVFYRHDLGDGLSALFYYDPVAVEVIEDTKAFRLKLRCTNCSSFSFHTSNCIIMTSQMTSQLTGHLIAHITQPNYRLM